MSTPDQSSSGVYVKTPPAPRTIVPCSGSVISVTVSEPASFHRTSPSTGSPASVDQPSSAAVGVTVRDTVPVRSWPDASRAVYVKESVPEYPAVGV